MQLRTLFATLVVATGLSITPAHAQTILPCDVYMCMAGISGFGDTGGPGCAPALAFWHAPSPAGLAVWGTYVFLPPASAALRRTYLSTCPGASLASNAVVMNAIITEWGSLP